MVGLGGVVMPTYEYECDRCKRTFEAEQRITAAPLSVCPLPDARTRVERFHEFQGAGGAISWNRRPFSEHPDRCVCQGDDPTPHRHHSDWRLSCARCSCVEYTPAFSLACGGSLRRLIPGSTSFVLKGSGWFKDGY